jgi:hypothetical protein
VQCALLGCIDCGCGKVLILYADVFEPLNFVSHVHHFDLE